MGTNFWKADKAQFLLDKIAFKDGTEIVKAAADPTVTAIDAPADSLCLYGKKIYVKQDAGSTTNWLDTQINLAELSTGIITGGTTGTGGVGDIILTQQVAIITIIPDTGPDMAEVIRIPSELYFVKCIT